MYSYLNASPVRGLSDCRRGKEVMKISARSILQLALAIFLSVSAGLAQQITGSITGTVADPSGAAVAGAAVKITHKGTGAGHAPTNNNTSDFLLLLLPPGELALVAPARRVETLLPDR